ncbi:hypothetical protein Sango_1904200 [Sesamum angolense]|uniref:CCHC-type domain-containing protein n=1 Tax=Sesamum angolense TaxID=2727404 RepID=A0AAE1WJH7_9LAMI|nr:hypothetical protein Sango_1904200 [Sesamum angolense]
MEVDIMNQLRCHISRDQAYRAKRQALKKLEGSPEQQFTKLWDYAEELRRTNPGSTIILGVNDVNRFEKFYVCLSALKKGFLGGCRPIICVDGCHLKGPHKGILLTAVGVDPNNNLYPIAYSVVQKESRDTWEWFLTVLKQDLCIQRDNEYTFMSDKQKGLIQAFQSVFPNSTHRFCVRHLHNNFKNAGYRGLAYKNALWKAARASTVGEFKLRMEEMKQLNQDAFDWFNDKPPTEWSIPCKHACSAIFNQNLQPEDMVHPYYNVDTYKQVYEHAILPISGQTLWNETGLVPPLPPNFGRGPGRPAGARNREPDEPNVKTTKKSCKKPIKLQRQKVKHHCKICGEEGHNAKGCALWKDMQEPALIRKSWIVSFLTIQHRNKEMNMTAAASGVSDQPHILPPIVEDNEPTEIEFTPEILTEAGPSQTQASVQGPTMFEQLHGPHKYACTTTNDIAAKAQY